MLELSFILISQAKCHREKGTFIRYTGGTQYQLQGHNSGYTLPAGIVNQLTRQ